MKTNCFKREVLFAYANAMLDERERARVEAHLVVCAACREAVAGYQKLDVVLGEWKPAEPSVWFDAQARARIESGARPQPWHAGQFAGWKRWTAIAAIAAVALAASLMSFRAFRQGRTAATVAVATPTHAAPAAPIEASAAPTPQPVEASAAGQAAPAPAESASQEMDLYENLKVLENYDMLANFKVLSELPQASDKSND